MAAHRQSRPWSGDTVGPGEREVPRHDPACHLCPGVRRVSGVTNPEYTGTFAFDNDHPCVAEEAPVDLDPTPEPYLRRPASGIARVMCYSPRHDRSLSELDDEGAVALLRAWQDQHQDLGSRSGVESVLIFENRGEAAGVSNPHPHCQLYGTNFVFKTVESEARVCATHLKETGRGLFDEILSAEVADGRRVLDASDAAIAFVPFFARYPYEMLVAPRERHASITDLAHEELVDLAGVLRRTLARADNLWRMPFPYVMVLHQAPTDGHEHPAFHFHIEIHPPLRAPNLLKYLAGPEVGGGNFLNDASPEDAAAELLAQPDVHYRDIAG